MRDAWSERMRAVKLTLPVMCGYLFLGTAFGATLAQAGFGPAWALMMSGLVYAGSMQFVMVPLMASGAALTTVALTALMVNARHLFYGVSYIERFRRMGRLRPYMIFSLTDETYSVFCGLPGEVSDGVMLRVALYDQLYWIAGSVIGAALAQALPFDLTGIDYSMTALFIVICVDRARNKADRLPAAVGGVCALVCLMLLGPERFLAPALAVTAVLLMGMESVGRRKAA
ncbi:MAG: AzlC family ABC transporter permease [Candidatus Ventricola sp.]